uniref:STI1 domain-containing protein n=1 Tax=Attheya septentrionalis TaxID=420275 RepID=A0A7S2XNN3_9STRA
MTDAQIRAAADQMELMASNPEMMKMAADQMKGMSAEDMQQAMQQGAAAGSATSSGAAAAPTMDPAAMMQNMDPAQLKQMLNMVKKNPDLLKQMLKSQGVGSQISEEQLNKGVELFSQMDEKQLEKAIGMMSKVHRVAQPFVNGWKKVNDGCFRGQLSKVIFTMVMGLAFYGGWRLLFGGAPSDVVMDLNSFTASSEPLAAPTDDLEQEF